MSNAVSALINDEIERLGKNPGAPGAYAEATFLAKLTLMLFYEEHERNEPTEKDFEELEARQ